MTPQKALRAILDEGICATPGDEDSIISELNRLGFVIRVKKKSRRKTKPQPRYEIAEDGPERFIVFDNWDDSDCPVFETRNEAIAYVEQQSA